MITKLDRDQIAAELASLGSLIDSRPANDFLGRIGLEARRDEIKHQFESLSTKEDRRAKVALYFGGEPVLGSAGIHAGFGTRVIGSFQELVSKVWGSNVSGQLQAMGPIKDREASQLHITNLVQGSFGFLLEELDEQGEPLFVSELCKATDQVADYIVSFAGENEAVFATTIEDLNPRVFQSLRDFIGHVYKSKATFRLVEGDRDEKFDYNAVERAWHRAEALTVDEEQIRLEGKLLGVIPMRRRFEFEPVGDSSIIEGKVGEKFSQSYLERITTEQFAGRHWSALLHKRVITKVGRPPVDNFTLIELDEIGSK